MESVNGNRPDLDEALAIEDALIAALERKRSLLQQKRQLDKTESLTVESDGTITEVDAKVDGYVVLDTFHGEEAEGEEVEETTDSIELSGSGPLSDDSFDHFMTVDDWPALNLVGGDGDVSQSEPSTVVASLALSWRQPPRTRMCTKSPPPSIGGSSRAPLYITERFLAHIHADGGISFQVSSKSPGGGGGDGAAERRRRALVVSATRSRGGGGEKASFAPPLSSPPSSSNITVTAAALVQSHAQLQSRPTLIVGHSNGLVTLVELDVFRDGVRISDPSSISSPPEEWMFDSAVAAAVERGASREGARADSDAAQQAAASQGSNGGSGNGTGSADAFTAADAVKAAPVCFAQTSRPLALGGEEGGGRSCWSPDAKKGGGTSSSLAAGGGEMGDTKKDEEEEVGGRGIDDSLDSVSMHDKMPSLPHAGYQFIVSTRCSFRLPIAGDHATSITSQPNRGAGWTSLRIFIGTAMGSIVEAADACEVASENHLTGWSVGEDIPVGQVQKISSSSPSEASIDAAIMPILWPIVELQTMGVSSLIFRLGDSNILVPSGGGSVPSPNAQGIAFFILYLKIQSSRDAASGSASKASSAPSTITCRGASNPSSATMMPPAVITSLSQAAPVALQPMAARFQYVWASLSNGDALLFQTPRTQYGYGAGGSSDSSGQCKLLQHLPFPPLPESSTSTGRETRSGGGPATCLVTLGNFIILANRLGIAAYNTTAAIAISQSAAAASSAATKVGYDGGEEWEARNPPATDEIYLHVGSLWYSSAPSAPSAPVSPSPWSAFLDRFGEHRLPSSGELEDPPLRLSCLSWHSDEAGEREGPISSPKNGPASKRAALSAAAAHRNGKSLSYLPVAIVGSSGSGGRSLRSETPSHADTSPPHPLYSTIVYDCSLPQQSRRKPAGMDGENWAGDLILTLRYPIMLVSFLVALCYNMGPRAGAGGGDGSGDDAFGEGERSGSTSLRGWLSGLGYMLRGRGGGGSLARVLLSNATSRFYDSASGGAGRGLGSLGGGVGDPGGGWNDHQFGQSDGEGARYGRRGIFGMGQDDEDSNMSDGTALNFRDDGDLYEDQGGYERMGGRGSMRASPNSWQQRLEQARRRKLAAPSTAGPSSSSSPRQQAHLQPQPGESIDAMLDRLVEEVRGMPLPSGRRGAANLQGRSVGGAGPSSRPVSRRREGDSSTDEEEDEREVEEGGDSFEHSFPEIQQLDPRILQGRRQQQQQQQQGRRPLSKAERIVHLPSSNSSSSSSSSFPASRKVAAADVNVGEAGAEDDFADADNFSTAFSEERLMRLRQRFLTGKKGRLASSLSAAGHPPEDGEGDNNSLGDSEGHDGSSFGPSRWARKIVSMYSASGVGGELGREDGDEESEEGGHQDGASERAIQRDAFIQQRISQVRQRGESPSYAREVPASHHADRGTAYASSSTISSSNSDSKQGIGKILNNMATEADKHVVDNGDI